MTSTAPVAGPQSGPAMIDALLRPRGVALIGASRDPKALGGRPLGFLARYGYQGPVYPVNGRGGEVQGMTAYASVLDLPGPVDLALVMVRAELVPPVLRECAAANVRIAVIVSSGFGEGTGAGAELLAAARAELAGSGMRILGPNCEGLASLAASAPLTFSPVLDIDASGTRLTPGNVAVLSQSGGMGFAVAQWGTAAGLSFSYIISTGNEYDLDCLELAGQLVDDPETEVVAMLIEAVSDLEALAAVGTRFRRAGKRLVVAKLGQSEPGARGAYAHTRHVAGDAAEYRRVFAAAGITEAADAEELVDMVQAITKTRALGTAALPAGARVGIATTSGGAGVWFADACAARGLTVPPLSASLQEVLKGYMPTFGSPVNPVDLTAQLTAGGSVVPPLAALAGSGEVDAVALVTSLSSAGRLERDAPALADLVRRCAVPLFVFTYTRPAPSCAAILQDLGVPWYTSAARAARGLAALVSAPEAGRALGLDRDHRS
jgi:acyl-CoA synthetase (NDP forming)